MSDFEFLINVKELRDNFERDDWRIVDCRFNLLEPEQGFSDYQAGHIPGATYAHLDRDLAGTVTDTSGRHPLPDAAAMAATLAGMGIGNDHQVVVYDDASGAIAARLWWLLKWLGHSRVALLNGGYKAWSKASPVSQLAPEFPVTSFAGRPDMGRVISTAELVKRLESDSSIALVDARDRPRFAGEAEPIDDVAGHVPGAKNFPFNQNLTENGDWLDEDSIASGWAALGDSSSESERIVMCGSGVTACHLAIAAEIAGLRPPLLYVGSWSEWIRDPLRPVATGEA